jgi:polyisoprenoid-binding protein YceI
MKKASWCAGLTMLFVFTTLAAAQTPAATGVPVFQFDKAKSSIGFNVKASVAIAGKFDKWDATMTFTSPDVSTGVLDIKCEAASVNTGSGMKDGKLTPRIIRTSRSIRRRLFRPVPTHLKSMETSLYAV